MAKKTKEFKAISHVERMCNPKLKQKLIVKLPADKNSALSGLCASDFALENVIAANASHLLRPQMLDGNIDATIAGVAALDAALDALPDPNTSNE